MHHNMESQLPAIQSRWNVKKQHWRNFGINNKAVAALGTGYCERNVKLRGFDGAILMSHRGGSLENVENSLTAFRHSAASFDEVREGIPDAAGEGRAKPNAQLVLEMDARLTSDGCAVVLHDSLLSRLCASPVTVGSLAFENLPLLNVPTHISSHSEDPDFRRIPLLEEVLKEFPTIPMQIDVKDGPEELVIKVGNLIKQYHRENITVWGSFRPDINNLCYKHFSTDIPLFFDWKRALLSYSLSWLGLTHWISYRESALICPNLSWILRRPWGAGKNAKAGGAPGGGINTVEGFENV
ncbi:hypothetical protein HK100_008740, partial [Physocladia obscura]